ncbi:hypothetical protein M0804_004095 [Polistes exclamans]|nr:hypothetical protein M0804_004095 [Polistes exclamans]
MEQCRGGCSHEMVKSPATAATMAYPLEEERRRRSRGREDLENLEHGNEKGKDSGECGRVSDSIEKTNFHSVSRDHRHKSILSSNRHFTCSTDENNPFPLTSELLYGRLTDEDTRQPEERRSRKQRKPRRSVRGLHVTDEQSPENLSSNNGNRNASGSRIQRKRSFDETQDYQTDEGQTEEGSYGSSISEASPENFVGEDLLDMSASSRFLDNRMSQLNMSASNSSPSDNAGSSYTNSLTNQKLLGQYKSEETEQNVSTKKKRHSKKNSNQAVRNYQSVSSVTLKATLFTNPRYNFKR